MRIQVRLFAMLREQAGSAAVDVELADGATAGDVWPALGLGEEPDGLAVAVNRSYASRSTALADGDEVAFIPPVSGGAVRPAVALTRDPIDLAAVVRQVEQPGAGAIATFSGTVREHSRGKDVERLAYEAYDEMVLAELERIAAEVAARHDLLGIAITHRAGDLAVGDTSVVIACAAAHRASALSACAEAIEALKSRVPIWKKEHYADGATWIGQGS